MPQRIISRGEDNLIRDVPAGRDGQVLTTDRFGVSWKDYDASTLGYADKTHHGLTNVEKALDHVLSVLYDIKTDFAQADLHKTRDALTEVNREVAALKRTLETLRQSVDDQNEVDESPSTRGVAQALNNARRTASLTRRLRGHGTYDNNTSGAKATNVQDALDELFALLKISGNSRNTLRRDAQGALYAEPVTVTATANVLPVSQDGNTINFAPAQVAHLRIGQSVELEAGLWTVLETELNRPVFDSLAASGQSMIVLAPSTMIWARSDGFYRGEVIAEHKASIVINGVVLETPVWYGHLNENDHIQAALWSDADETIVTSVNLVVQRVA